MKRSALFHLHQRAGAKFAERHGWEMPLSFTLPESEASQVRERTGLTDLSYRTKFDTRAEPERPFCCLGRDHYLVTGEPPFDPPSRSTDVTSVYGDLFLAGPRSKAVLSKLTSLNLSDITLPNLYCAQASVAYVRTSDQFPGFIFWSAGSMANPCGTPSPMPVRSFISNHSD